MDTSERTSDEATVALTSEEQPVVPPSPTSIEIGALLGRYLVIEEVGRGGMGIVARAYDPRLQREVALKTVPLARSATAEERTVREARAMAMLSHPNIVAVYDVEMAGDAVVLVMEFVDGQTLREWLGQARRWQEIVAAFLAAGRGLAAAHHVGLLHRDFKPANVMLGRDGRVRVTDFGLARSQRADVDRSGGEEQPALVGSAATEVTELGVVLGTPAYMAPELFETVEIGPAVDQYAFCVALWEALAGQRPWQGEGKALLAHKLADVPAWPRDAAAPRQVGELLRRGLAPEPSARWPDLQALLVALERSTRRGRRWLVVSGVVAAAALVAGVLAVTRASPCSGAHEQITGIWDDDRRATARAAVLGTGLGYADGVWSHVETELDAYAADWEAAHVDACEASTVRGEQSATVLDLRMGCLQRARQKLAAASDMLAEADAQVVASAARVLDGLPDLHRCAEVDVLLADVPPPNEEQAPRVEAIRVELAAAAMQTRAGRYRQATATIEELESRSSALGYAPLRTEVLRELASALSGLGEYARASAALKSALRSALESGQWDEACDAATTLVLVAAYLARPDEGFAYADVAWGLLPRASAREATESDLRNNIGSLYLESTQPEAAEREMRAALELRVRALGPDDLRTLASHNNLAASLHSLARYDEAEAELRIALAIATRVLGPWHPTVALIRPNVAAVLSLQGRDAEAEVEHREAIRAFERGGGDHPAAANEHRNLALTLFSLRRPREAEAECRLALAGLSRTLGPVHPDTALAHECVGDAMSALEHPLDAEIEYRVALSLIAAARPPTHPEATTIRLSLVHFLQRRGRPMEARALLEPVVAPTGDGTLGGAELAAALADVLWSAGVRERERALSLARRARDELAALGTAGASDLAVVEKWLHEHDS